MPRLKYFNTETNQWEYVSANGVAGKDGYTPVKGIDYHDGDPGIDGKSAYEYALDAGYTGTEAEFTEKMAKDTAVVTVKFSEEDGNLSITNDGITFADIVEFAKSGRQINAVLIYPPGLTYSCSLIYLGGNNLLGEMLLTDTNNNYLPASIYLSESGATLHRSSHSFAKSSEIPTDDHINALIDSKLGVIENGSY